MTGSVPAVPRLLLKTGCAASVSRNSSGSRGRCTAVAVGCTARAAAARRGSCSGETGSGGVEGGDMSAPSSWAKTVSSPGDEQPLRFFAALVNLGEGTRLQLAADCRGGDAATAAYEGAARGVPIHCCNCCKLSEVTAAAGVSVCIAGLLLAVACCRSLNTCRAGSCCRRSLRWILLRCCLSRRFWLGLRLFLRLPVGAAATEAAAAMGRLWRETCSPSLRCSITSFDHLPAPTY